jgi:hypothetical protein
MLGIHKTRVLRLVVRARWTVRRQALAVRSAVRRLRRQGFSWRRWWLPATGALIAVVGVALASHGKTPATPVIQQELVAVAADGKAVDAGAPGAVAVVVSEKSPVSEFEQIMRDRAARNLRLLEVSLIGVGLMIALGAIVQRIGGV